MLMKQVLEFFSEAKLAVTFEGKGCGTGAQQQCCMVGGNQVATVTEIPQVGFSTWIV
jgi:hypothetical protein